MSQKSFYKCLGNEKIRVTFLLTLDNGGLKQFTDVYECSKAIPLLIYKFPTLCVCKYVCLLSPPPILNRFL